MTQFKWLIECFRLQSLFEGWTEDGLDYLHTVHKPKVDGTNIFVQTKYYNDNILQNWPEK